MKKTSNRSFNAKGDKPKTTEIVERMTTKTVDICTCGLVMHQLDVDDYDTLGTDEGVCCPDCGNEKFQTIAELRDENKRLKEQIEKMCFHVRACDDCKRNAKIAHLALNPETKEK